MSKTGLIFSSGAIAVSLLLGYFWVYPQARGVIAARSWTAVPCTIKSAHATRIDRNKNANSPRYFDLELSYSFQADGRTVVGDRRSFAEELVGPSSRHEELSAKYPPGSAQTCYYNPANPRDAVLDRGINASMWPAAIPLTLFVLGSIFLIGLLMQKTAPVSSDVFAAVRAGDNIGTILGMAFTLVGLVLSYFLLWKPMSAMVAARSWVAAPCEITGSTVERHGYSRSGTGTSYDWVVNYRYDAAGRTIIRDRWSFWPALQGRQNAQAARAARYPKGMSTTCYYNPAAPDEAVLDRGFTYSAWLMLFALATLGIGVISVAASIERNRDMA